MATRGAEAATYGAATYGEAATIGAAGAMYAAAMPLKFLW